MLNVVEGETINIFIIYKTLAAVAPPLGASLQHVHQFVLLLLDMFYTPLNVVAVVGRQARHVQDFD